MNNLDVSKSIFESIKHVDEFGEYWSARELQKALDYTEWIKFDGIVKKAINACLNSNYNVKEHFVGADKLSNCNNNATVVINDYRLSRYACYSNKKTRIIRT